MQKYTYLPDNLTEITLQGAPPEKQYPLINGEGFVKTFSTPFAKRMLDTMKANYDNIVKNGCKSPDIYYAETTLQALEKYSNGYRWFIEGWRNLTDRELKEWRESGFPVKLEGATENAVTKVRSLEAQQAEKDAQLKAQESELEALRRQLADMQAGGKKQKAEPVQIGEQKGGNA